MISAHGNRGLGARYRTTVPVACLRTDATVAVPLRIAAAGSGTENPDDHSVLPREKGGKHGAPDGYASEGSAQHRVLPVIPVAGDLRRELENLEARLNPLHVSLP